MGITNYTDPSPGATNGIIIWFDSPIDYIRFDLSANRVGSPGIVNAYSDNSTLLFTDSFNSFDFYKGTYERTFTENVNSIVVYSASPNYTPVGIRNFEFELKPSAPIPEPASIALVLIGMAGLVAVRKPA